MEKVAGKKELKIRIEMYYLNYKIYFQTPKIFK